MISRSPTLGRRVLVALFAVWIAAGPLAGSAAATLEASHAGCRSAAGKLGCHGAKGRVSCHGPARKIGCHDSASATHGQAREEDQTRSQKRERCGCSDLAISSARCGCRHGSPAAAVSLERTLPRPTFVLSRFAVGRDRGPELVALAPVVPADPPDPPPRLLSSPHPY